MANEVTPIEQQKVDNRINMPIMFVACVVTLIGVLLMLTVALIWIGGPITLIGMAWIAILFWSAKIRARHSDVINPNTRDGPARAAVRTH